MEAVCGSRRAHAVLVLCAFLAIHAALALAADHTAGDKSLSYHAVGSDCRGSIAECLAEMDSEEFAMESESTRRMLAAARYISYGALRRNSVPCSRRGSSYYNCRPGAHANPYSRGCSRITRCRS